MVSHVRKGSLAYRTGVLHLGDKLLALNGQKVTSVEDAITFIDAIPLGEIVSVAIQKEQEVEGKMMIRIFLQAFLSTAVFLWVVYMNLN